MSCLNCGGSVFEGALCPKCRNANHQDCANQTANMLASFRTQMGAPLFGPEIEFTGTLSGRTEPNSNGSKNDGDS